MLGVVRVFSRKSTIMLSDLSSILQTLSRFKAASQALPSRKRHRDMQAAPPGACSNISLKPHEANAQYEAITIPAIKKRRRQAGIDVSNGISPRIHTDDAFLSSLPDTPSSAEHNVLTMMETFFPSVPTPHGPDGVSLSPGLTPRSSGNHSETYRHLEYAAREEDITLPVQGIALDPIAVTDMFDDDEAMGSAGPSIGGRSSSDRLSIVRSLFQPAGDGSGSVPLPDNARDQDIPIPAADLALMEPIDLEPLQLTDLPARMIPRVQAQIDLTEADDGAAQAQGSNERQRASVIADVSRGNGTGALPTSDHMLGEERVESTLDEAAEEGREGVRGTRRAKTVGTKTGRTRNRREDEMAIDETTELSAREFRTFLNDTSDIVLASDEDRTNVRKGRGRRRGGDQMRKLPKLMGRFAKELCDMWQEITDDGMELTPVSAAEDLTAGRITDNMERGRNGRMAGRGSAVLEAQGSVMGDQDVPVTREQLVPQMPAIETGDGESLGLFDAIVPGESGDMGDSSVEQMRAPGRDKHSRISGSVEDRSFSLSVPSRRFSSSKGTETVRDRLFDMVSFQAFDGCDFLGKQW